MNERLRDALRRTIRRHNELVWLSSLTSAVIVCFMWAGIYFISRWLIIFFSTVVKGLDAVIPQHFDRGFFIVVAIWMIVGWIARQRGFFRTLRSESSSSLTLLELLLTPPRATFGALQNIRNRIRLSEEDLVVATDFLVRVVRAGKMATTNVPVELPDDTSRDKIILALQLLDLIYLRKVDDITWYSVANPQRLLRFLE